jgi:hypothetical protein
LRPWSVELPTALHKQIFFVLSFLFEKENKNI